MYILIMVLFWLCFDMDEEYKTAFNYIKQDSLKSSFLLGETRLAQNEIFVADSLIFIETTFFLDDLIDFKYGEISKSKKQNIRNDEYLKQIEKDKKFKGYKLKELNSFNKDDRGDFILYFSTIEKGTLLAELFEYPKNKEKINVNNLRFFNKSIQYLFYFNTQNKLLKVFKRETHYN